MNMYKHFKRLKSFESREWCSRRTHIHDILVHQFEESKKLRRDRLMNEPMILDHKWE